MRRVAGEEHAAAAPVVGDQRVEAIARLAPELAVLGREPAREQLPRPSGVAAAPGFAGLERDLPAAVVLRADHQRAGALGLAVLHAVRRQLRQPALVDQHVDDQPGLVEVEVFEADAGERATVLLAPSQAIT